MIEVVGVIEFCESAHTFVDVVVTNCGSCRQVAHRAGVDIKPNKGKIITLLGTLYDVPPGEIAWPAHIELERGV